MNCSNYSLEPNHIDKYIKENTPIKRKILSDWLKKKAQLYVVCTRGALNKRHRLKVKVEKRYTTQTLRVRKLV